MAGTGRETGGQMERWERSEVDEHDMRGTGNVKRQVGQHAATPVQDLDLPGSVGISEPSFATHLQPLTRCHWSKNNHAGHPSISNGMGNTMHKHTLRLFYIYTLHAGPNEHANKVSLTPMNSFWKDTQKHQRQTVPEALFSRWSRGCQDIQLHCRPDRRTDGNQTGGQSRAKPCLMPDEAVKDAVLSFIRTADT